MKNFEDVLKSYVGKPVALGICVGEYANNHLVMIDDVTNLVTSVINVDENEDGNLLIGTRELVKTNQIIGVILYRDFMDKGQGR